MRYSTHKTRILLLSLGIFCYPQQAKTQSRSETILSPDRHIQLILSVTEGKAQYTVLMNGQTVLNPADLGLSVGQQQFGPSSGLRLRSKSQIKESYPWRGVHSKATDHCTEATVAFTGSSPSQRFRVESRVYNDGVAFRYLIDTIGAQEVTAEGTRFSILPGSLVWRQNDYHAYEDFYKMSPIADVKPGPIAGPPLLVQLPDSTGFLAITEGGVERFAGMALKPNGDNSFTARLGGPSHTSGPIRTPWRIIEIGRDLNTLVNCDIIANVSPKPDPGLFPKGFATDWIRPGKSAWSWLAANGPVSFENMKRFSKWAGELGISYNLVDEGWSKWQDGDKDQWALLRELVDYSTQQNVKVWVWKAYPDRAGIPGLKDPKARWDFFSRCSRTGIAGLKIDFFDTESQEVQAFYQDALRDAAQLHLMLDFHGAGKPTGQSRTWPNEMTREGIHGLENGDGSPGHDVTLLFTRFLAGHADFTPLTLDPKLARGSTLSHQLATVAAFTSPFMCLGVNPEALLSSPIRMMVRDLPVVWDETRVLPQSRIGSLGLLARRSGKNWYLVALNGEHAQNITLNLDFLSKGQYTGQTFEDLAGKPDGTDIRRSAFNRKSTVTIRLTPGGGFLGCYRPLSNSGKR